MNPDEVIAAAITELEAVLQVVDPSAGDFVIEAETAVSFGRHALQTLHVADLRRALEKLRGLLSTEETTGSELLGEVEQALSSLEA